MMKPTGLLAACGVLVVLGGLVIWFQKHPAKPESTTPASPKILTLGEDQIEALRLAKPGAEAIVLKKAGTRWMIAEPKELFADDDAVKSILSSLASLTADRLIDEKPSDLTGFGLTSPAEEIDITLKGGTINKLLIGTDTPSGSSTYVKLDSSPKVFTISTSTRSNFEKSVTDLRDKRLLTFIPEKVTGVTVASKGPAVEFAKNGQNEWQITKPKPFRADSSQIDDLLRKLKDAKMDLTADTPDFASATKVGMASVTDGLGTQTLEIRQAKDKSYLAKSSVVEGAYKLTGDLADGLKDKDLDSFRNRKLFDFGFNDPAKIEINGATYQKTGDKWNGPSGQIDPGSIQSVIDKLRDLNAARFADKMAGTQALQVAVTSGDKGKVEKVTLNKAGDDYEARRADDPAVYVIKAAIFDEIQGAVKAIKPYQAPKPGPADKDKKK